ncbi:MAG TPA: VWA domain-containing protein [Thermoanaerobaculia bacterium]|nr:VWA domain-containing protein [Thermoanaerobaculia bacterium]
MKKSALSALCLAWAVAGLPALAQQKKPPQAPEPPVFGETLEVRVVNVEVVVTDKDGNRVTGLKPGDFKLKVDGKDVPVTYFTEVAGGQSVAPPAAAEGAPAPATAAVPGVEPGGGVGTSYLVFIDDYFSTEVKRNEILRSLKSDLARLGPEDRMAIVTYDGGRLAMISNWSQSQAQLARAFDDAMGRRPRGLDRIVEYQRFAHDEEFAGGTAGDSAPLDLASASSRQGFSQLNLREKAYGEVLFRQEQGVVNAVARTLRTFAAPPGRKVLLLLDGGWPYSIQGFIRGDAAPSTSREFKDGEELLRNLTNTANLLGYTVYPIDGQGLQSADESSTSSRVQEITGTLDFVAQETGGTTLRAGNRTLALAKAAGDTRSYYWLGFSPSWEHNDARHKVDVSVSKPGLKVRSRNSFLDLSKKTEVTMMVESALLFGNLPGDSPLPLRIGALKKVKGGTEIPITLGLPADVVTLVQVGNKYAAHAELRFAASDETGNGSEIPVVPLDIASDKPAKPGGFIKYETKITLKGKANRLVATVYDPVSGKLATAETALTMP